MKALSQEILKSFDFHKIVERLSKSCSCGLTREWVMQIKPLASSEEIAQSLWEVKEYMEMLTFDTRLDFDQLEDLRETLNKLSKERSILYPEELIKILRLSSIASNLKNTVRSLSLDEKYPSLKKYFQKIDDLSEVKRELEKTVSPEGKVLDTASANLLKIRTRIQHLQAEIEQVMRNLVRHYYEKKLLQEAIHTVRRGRYVIPVKASQASKIQGIVIDSSSSGSTVFIEPQPILQLNNQIEILRSQEQEEILRILSRVSDLLRTQLEALQRSFYNLVQLDFIKAKATLACTWKGCVPSLSKNQLYIKEGRHPLLGEKAVPFDLDINSSQPVMVVSGPNAGGKTVLIKALAMNVYLTHCGIPPALGEGSVIPLLEEIYVDIGDHQNLENNLSTFTSRMSKLKEAISQLKPDSLFLIDEIGSGTDPEEGSALGVALLEFLAEKGVLCVATTHLPKIKFAFDKNQKIKSASLEFDPVTLRPTFKLKTGKVGSSFGIKVAELIGMPEEIIKRALQKIDQDYLVVNNLLLSLEQKEKEMEEILSRLREKEERLSSKERELHLLQEELEKKRKEVVAEFTATMQAYLRKTQQEIANKVGKLRKENALNETVYQELKEVIAQSKKHLQALQVEAEEKKKAYVPEREEHVYLPDFQKWGRVISVNTRKKRAIVEIKGQKVKVPLDKIVKGELKSVEQEEAFQNSSPVRVSVPSKKTITNELEIRKLTQQEALMELEKYLDRALVAGFKTVYIIHGKGEGVLRKITHEYLKQQPFVESFRTGTPQEGGLGVTVVKLK
ncbi:MAG: mismatch repair protein MutS2 [Candidatus Atribacteria bacterium]|nr:mismatch repair protein MutS2 [Candidatus Atribacteria bacterium]